MERTARVTKEVALTGMMVAMMMASGTVAGACTMETVERAAYGPYSGKACVVANSETSWNDGMAALEAAGALLVLPAPEPPVGIDWANEVVVLVAAGATGYDIELSLIPGEGQCKVNPQWVRLEGHDGGESLPYHVVRMPKAMGLKDLTVMGSDVDATLPLTGSDGSTPAGATTWGQVKAAYR